ncbi:MAG: hypothetical protein V4672_09870 [Verrucomicrobiota bacterium]
MITVNTQIHGYRQGHQLLESTISLPKFDQSVVDRLSDVAGPLRPGEKFEPYLSAYPLPSGQLYVLARTWQDLTVPRAGCVRTLSVIILVEDWQRARGLQSFLDLLDPHAFPPSATSTELVEVSPAALPRTPEFRASELLEALFLEDQKPVALFDAPSPELIAIRLLTALWPALRRRFALSTFALSPRKVEGRHFDLVFAPKDARAKFANWPGRRIDAYAGTVIRHRWTSEIVERVFQSPIPRLLADHDIRLLGTEESGTPAALRIALLWDELLAKLEQSPSAALGLLDIANSKMDNRSAALHDLQPALAIAAQRASEQLPSAEAWEFLGAMVRKLFGTPLALALPSVTDAIGVLASRSPAGAIALLDQGQGEDAIEAIVPTIADGLAVNFGEAAAQALERAQSSTYKQLILANHRLARATLTSPHLVKRLAHLITELEPPIFDSLRDEIMPAIVDDRHAILARPIFGSLNLDGLLAEIEHLNKANRFQSIKLFPPLIERARQLSAIEELRSALLSIASSHGRDEFLRMTLAPVADDAWWLLRRSGLSKGAVSLLLENLVQEADLQQFQNLFAHAPLALALLELFATKRDILLRAVTEGQLPLVTRVPIVLQLLADSAKQQKRELATSLMNDCLRGHFGGDELATLSTLFSILESDLDGSKIMRMGLGRAMPASVVNRNIVAFNTSSKRARQQLLGAIEDLAVEMARRLPLDLDRNAAAACAVLLWDAQSVNSKGAINGAGRFLPTLFRSGRAPVSAIVAAAFPLVYLELAKEDDVPDFFKFVPFLDWDRCKTARRELVDTFLSSDTWLPSDLALTACRAREVDKILRRVAKSDHSKLYLKRIAGDLEMLPPPCSEDVKRTLAHIQSE